MSLNSFGLSVSVCVCVFTVRLFFQNDIYLFPRSIDVTPYDITISVTQSVTSTGTFVTSLTIKPSHKKSKRYIHCLYKD